MKRSILCRLGWHKWKAIYRERRPFNRLFPFEYIGQRCTRCEKRRYEPDTPDDGNYD